jgi:hypothetical protein
MKHSVFALATLLASLAALAPARPAAATDSSANAPATAVASMDSERDIVLAVANPLEPASTHAGSNLLGYAPSAHYGAGPR